jgi:hypothetical protein
MDSYIIQVHPQEELTVVIDKIMNTQAGRVYLLIPEKSRVAEHLLNFRLLKREADTLGKEIIVVSESPRVQSLAVKSSLKAHQETPELKQEAQKTSRFGKVSKSPRLADIMPSASVPEKIIPVKQIKTEIKVKEHEEILPVRIRQLAEKDSLTSQNKIASFWNKHVSSDAKSPLFKLPRILPKNLPSLPKINIHLNFNNARLFRAVLFSLIGISAVVAAVTFYSILPSAKVFITPLTYDITLEMDISDSIDTQVFEKRVESSKTALATGEREVRDKATGTIKVYNAYSSSPQTLVKTTRFVSESGALFRTTETIVVPGAEVEDGKIISSFTNVSVVASEPGSEYNIGPSTFSIPGFKGTPKYLAFYGKSESAFTGGNIGVDSVVTQNDYDNLRKDLNAELESKVSDALNLLMPQGFVIPDGASHIGKPEIISSKNVSNSAKEFTMTGSIAIKAIAIKEEDVVNSMRSDFESEFPDKKIVENGGKVTYEVSHINFEKGTLNLKASMTQKAIPDINVNEIKENLVGKREDVVRSFLVSNPDIRAAKITFWPFWVNKIPEDLSRVEVVILTP